MTLFEEVHCVLGWLLWLWCLDFIALGPHGLLLSHLSPNSSVSLDLAHA